MITEMNEDKRNRYSLYEYLEQFRKTFDDEHWRAISWVQGHIYIHNCRAINHLQVMKDNSHSDYCQKSPSNAILNVKLGLEQAQYTMLY